MFSIVFVIATLDLISAWEPRIADAWEFRCFVVAGHLRAISQYNHYCVFPHFADANVLKALVWLMQAGFEQVLAMFYYIIKWRV